MENLESNKLFSITNKLLGCSAMRAAATHRRGLTNQSTLAITGRLAVPFGFGWDLGRLTLGFQVPPGAFGLILLRTQLPRSSGIKY